MKTVLLAGGMGTRISEESHLRPKPMIEIGGMPILWHIMKGYSFHGINDFVICLGYRGYMIKEFFANYVLHTSDVTVCMRENRTTFHRRNAEPWSVTLIDTGEQTMTGGRLRRVREYLGDEPFCLTYGDGLSDVDLSALVRHHRASGRLATVTAIRPPGRFGALELAGGVVERFQEKPAGDGGWINGGFFVLDPRVIDRIDGDATVWEQSPLQSLAADGELGAYRHEGFWQSMDTLREKQLLESLWASGRAPWKVWA
jgi:glucose-1-phosphate cytidylyltransferase